MDSTPILRALQYRVRTTDKKSAIYQVKGVPYGHFRISKWDHHFDLIQTKYDSSRQIVKWDAQFRYTDRIVSKLHVSKA